MKVRDGFVSNSSSSSFILPVDSDSEEVTVTLSIDALQRMFNSGDSDTSIDSVIRTESELKEYLLDQYGCEGYPFEKLLEENDYVEELYTDGMNMIQDGKTIVFGSVSYHDEGMERLLQILCAKITN